MRGHRVILLSAIVAAVFVGWYLLFDLGLAPGLSAGEFHDAPAAVIQDKATTYSPGQLVAGGKEKFDVSVDYFEQPTFIPHGIDYVRLTFLARTVDKPYMIFYFTDKPVVVSAFGFERNVVVKPATLGHLFNAVHPLSCASNSSDPDVANDGFDITRRGPDGITRRCLIPKDVGCTLLRRTKTYLEVFEAARKDDIEEVTDTLKRTACPPGFSITQPK